MPVKPRLKKAIDLYESNLIQQIAGIIENRLNDLLDRTDTKVILMHHGTIHGLDTALGRLGRSLHAVAIPMRAEDIKINWQLFYEKLPDMLKDKVFAGMMEKLGIIQTLEHVFTPKPMEDTEQNRKNVEDFEKAFGVDQDGKTS